ncbi:MAG: hypothetical protein MUE52_00220 [Tabrizicola sp.]|jgi:hypothetical protein|nr:hypothetical protein [Tabrizicola sp.]
MPKSPPATPNLPPPTRAQVWAEFLKWAVGVPVVVGVALGLIWLAYWATGSAGMMLRTEYEIGTIVMWLGLIMLMYPVALVFLVWDLRDGLRAIRDWDAMTPEAQAAALADGKAAAAASPRRRSRKKG